MSSPSSSQIKGGGRAVMSSECYEAVVSLLMSLDESCTPEMTTEDKGDDVGNDTRSNSSKHKQREARHFVEKLVSKYERSQLALQYNTSITKLKSATNLGCNSGKEIARRILSGAVATQEDEEKSKVYTGKVRIEIAEAIFNTSQGKVDSKEKSKSKLRRQSENDQQKFFTDSAWYFQKGGKKVIVLPRSTTIKELCKQAKSKLHLKSKSPMRAFVVPETHYSTSSSSFRIFELKHDLSGVQDDTTVYITTSEATSASKQTKSTLRHDDEEEAAAAMCVDLLEQVKEAYAIKEKQRRLKDQSGVNGATEQYNPTYLQPRLDSKKAALLASAKATLPAAALRSEILSASEKLPVVVLSGATGSGKSTQIPQFLYEQRQVEIQMQDKAGNENSSPLFYCRPYIVVTQPRRVAAISLAQRVAEEMGSPPPGAKGSLVGYIVRLDRRVADPTCRIIYCTIGVLLRMLICPREENDDVQPSEERIFLPPLSLSSISHLIIDEVHERDINTDFSLTLLRGILASNRHPELKLILMSATASADFFVDYFASGTRIAPAIEIPGRLYPIKTNWLSDCERFAATRISDHTGGPCRAAADSLNDTGMSGPVLSPRADQRIDNNFVRSLIAQILQQQRFDGEFEQTFSSSKVRRTGAILVFLPGKSEIESLARCLYDGSVTGDRSQCNILKLHSSLPRKDQQSVFQPAAVGTFKIVLATNVAETSVTIPDVSHVIDTGRVKESRFNAVTRIKELVTVWVSRASANQRAGRAGRTSAGTCWRLYTEEFFDKDLLDQTVPEMLRTPLDELIVQICLLYELRKDEHKAEVARMSKIGRDGGPKHIDFPVGVQPIQFLSKAPTPPPQQSLLEACRHLLEIDALHVVGSSESPIDSEDQKAWSYRLTPLGYHLSRLPMDAKVGKVLIIGCILGCVDGALTVAATLSCTKSCLLPLVKSNRGSDAAIQARATLVENGFGGRDWPGGTVKGDLIAMIAIFRAWKQKSSESLRWEFCKTHRLDMMTLKEIDQLRSQFLELMGDAGFVPRNAANTRNFTKFSMDDFNQSSEDALLTSCCLIGGLYPNICSLMRPRKGGPRGGRLITKDGNVCQPQIDSFQRQRVQSAAETGRDAYAVFHAKQTIVGSTTARKGIQRPPEVFLTEVNFISRFALLLFGGKLEISKNAIIVDGWLKFKVSNDDMDCNLKSVENAVLILALRETLDQVMLDHVVEAIASPDERVVMLKRHKHIIQVVRKLLAEES